MESDKQQPDQDDQPPHGSDTEFFAGLRLEGWRRWALLLVLLTGLTVAGYVWVGFTDETRVRIDYTTFLEQVEAGNVAHVTISGNRVRGALEEPAQTGNQEYTEFATYVPSIGDESLVATLRAANQDLRPKDSDLEFRSFEDTTNQPPQSTSHHENRRNLASNARFQAKKSRCRRLYWGHQDYPSFQISDISPSSTPSRYCRHLT